MQQFEQIFSYSFYFNNKIPNEKNNSKKKL